MSLTQDVLRLARGIREATSVLFITGAGVSADSGLPTYRGVGGLYNGATQDGLAIETVLSGEMLASRPGLCWKYIHQIEQACRGAMPNAAHAAIARIAEASPRGWVLTQNVDGLHRRCRSEGLLEIHGNVHELHCTACDWREIVDDYAALDAVLAGFGAADGGVPRCTGCNAVVRPRVVLFGEALPQEPLRILEQELRQGFDLVVSVGTTSGFPYIAAPVVMARRRGALTVEINPGTTEVSDVVELKIAAGARETFEALEKVLAS